MYDLILNPTRNLGPAFSMNIIDTILANELDNLNTPKAVFLYV